MHYSDLVCKSLGIIQSLTVDKRWDLNWGTTVLVDMVSISDLSSSSSVSSDKGNATVSPSDGKWGPLHSFCLSPSSWMTSVWEADMEEEMVASKDELEVLGNEDDPFLLIKILIITREVIPTCKCEVCCCKIYK